MSDMAYPNVYENEDGEVWAEIADYPEPGPVGQQYADASGLIVSLEGRETTSVRDCECPTPRPVCPDDEDGKPCRHRQSVPCWHFFTSDDPTDSGGEDVWFPHDDAGHTLILGHRYHPAGQHMPTGEEVLSCDASKWCGHPEQDHYREWIETPGQVAAFEGRHD